MGEVDQEMRVHPDNRLRRVNGLARLLDNAIAIPGTSARVGLDPLLGLIPGLGDFAGAALSAYIVLEGVRMGASRMVVARMIGNVALDTLLGSVPVLGDLFDAGWKANVRNVALLEQHVGAEHRVRRNSTIVVGAVVLLLVLLAVGGVALTVVAFKWLAALVSSPP